MSLIILSTFSVTHTLPAPLQALDNCTGGDPRRVDTPAEEFQSATIDLQTQVKGEKRKWRSAVVLPPTESAPPRRFVTVPAAAIKIAELQHVACEESSEVWLRSGMLDLHVMVGSVQI